MQPRYQIFLSSTFRDLREERQAALEAILELGHFPAGMEAFPAADATPWELIESIIADSDYYILIIGGKYGSTGPDGISYTEMEYNHAVKLNKPVLAFMHNAPDQIPVGKAELEAAARTRLEAFRARISARLWKGWTTKDELKAAVLLALVNVIRTKPAFGWIRNEGLQNQELLQRLAILQARYDKLEAETSELRKIAHDQVTANQFQSLDKLYCVQFKLNYGEDAKQQFAVEISWAELFFAMAEKMLAACSEYDLQEALRPLVRAAMPEGEFDKAYAEENARLREQYPTMGWRPQLNIIGDGILPILLQLAAKGLVEPQTVSRQHTNNQTTISRYWILTQLGRNKYLEKFAVRAEA